ncbi:MAG: AAA family ATPase [Microcoleus sp. PH2017_29_MFU_D_A]|jgi:Cdc6-like AAA superfamily ATPase|uniref:P-loop NTPase fold protein n=1 Tax=unclassified Microcoleus TaxID=2642155 RepID=UPI001D3EDAB6|nr:MULTISPECIES: P-loop NTPase fold protein [unclassified Microcoleus]MCC3470592.1 AAA family ATPase [Microcoleus sp. PH2017_13_LAR_U_A]MCC3483117.1 AAA family ATPase [Microcoleus sp. PH2017_14_LAR_D_A]MCC3595340.1 AAA family ATPase [Microcoleus sp. PH2017_26_ELK_O_A]MCC3604121.1 AAA family ATPase [Microcoleus sp. PH2017_29_MFU_D_A]MCC3620403.1 AAA family ATPase [Microcoleus sp. PH2017_36_ELK_O_B]
MTTLPINRATTLKAAYQVCNPLRSLEGADLDRYYVDLSDVRKTEAIAGVSNILDCQEPEQFTTILFTGHRGCGKSTELKRIQKEWEKDYRVIYLEVNEETDINDVGYTDFYLIAIKRVEFEMRRLGLKLDSRLMENFEAWFKDVTEETERSVESSVSLEGEVTLGPEAPFLAKLLVKLLAQIKGSDRQKKTIRQTLEKDISRLKADINLLLNDAVKKLRKKFPNYKGFLIIFDNLDRVPPNVANHLFFDYAAQLQELNCTMIYTVPLGALYSSQNAVKNFDCPHIIPMVNIYEFNRDICDLNYNEVNLNAMASLIERRVEVDILFESREQLLEVAKASGGHVRQLIQIMRTASITARGRGQDKIMAEDVTYAIKQEQFNFERLIPQNHYPLLAQVCLTKNINKDEISELMLFNLSVLEYNGKNRWNYPNPVVKQNEEFQKALRDAREPNVNPERSQFTN